MIGKGVIALQFTIRQARTHAGITQANMAKCLGIDRGTYRKLEQDISRCTVGQLLSISTITGIPVRDIFLPVDSTNEESTN